MIQDAAAASYSYPMPIYQRPGGMGGSGCSSLLAPDGTLSDAALADYCSNELRRMARAINQNAQASTSDVPSDDGSAGGAGAGGAGGAGGGGGGGGGGGSTGGGDATNLKLQTLVSNYQATVTRFSTMLASHGETKKSVANNTK